MGTQVPLRNPVAWPLCEVGPRAVRERLLVQLAFRVSRWIVRGPLRRPAGHRRGRQQERNEARPSKGARKKRQAAKRRGRRKRRKAEREAEIRARSCEVEEAAGGEKTEDPRQA